jgi:hypothetical protein
MSKLEILIRPPVVFDPTSRDHRRYYHESLVKQGWGHCPVRFVVEDEYGDVNSMVQRKLLKFYAEREFGKKTA